MGLEVGEKRGGKRVRQRTDRGGEVGSSGGGEKTLNHSRVVGGGGGKENLLPPCSRKKFRPYRGERRGKKKSKTINFLLREKKGGTSLLGERAPLSPSAFLSR